MNYFRLLAVITKVSRGRIVPLEVAVDKSVAQGAVGAGADCDVTTRGAFGTGAALTSAWVYTSVPYARFVLRTLFVVFAFALDTQKKNTALATP